MDSKKQIQSREIKFRAWDSREKKMDYDPFCWPTSIDLKDSYSNLNTLIAGQFGKVHHGGPVGEDNTHMRYLMQYTGLKDRNGKEIYESDIVERKEETCGSEIEMASYVVVWVDDCAKFELKTIQSPIFVKDAIVSMYLEDDAEVIGNLHENPELFNNL